MPRYNNIEILPEDTLSYSIFRVHVTYGNGYNAAVDGVIDMASHGCLLLDTLHMVEHHPRVFKITTRLHPLYQVYTAPRTHLRHLEYKYLIKIRALAREHVLLDIQPVVATSEHGDAKYDPVSPYVLE
jgi:hypothetical protein